MVPMLRSAALNGYADLALSLGVNPHPMMRTLGIDPAVAASAEGWLPVQAVNDLLELSAAETACEDFGLRLAAARGLSFLGPLGLVAREEPQVRNALEILVRHGNLNNDGLRSRLREMNGLATVRLHTTPGVTLGRQGVELSVAMICRILRDLLSDEWRPITVYFTHPAPADLEAHRREFSDDIEFDHDFNGIVCHSRDLDSPNHLSSPLLRPFTRRYLRSLTPLDDSTTDLVRHAIESLLPTRRCTADQVARGLGMNRRTLHRHLARTGDTFSALLNAVRVDLAQHHLARADHTLTEIAADLGFSELSAFSHWFRTHFGSPPSQWDRTQKAR